MDARTGIFPGASDRSFDQVGGWRDRGWAPLLFHVACVVAARQTIAFHFVADLPRDRSVGRRPRRDLAFRVRSRAGTNSTLVESEPPA